VSDAPAPGGSDAFDIEVPGHSTPCISWAWRNNAITASSRLVGDMLSGRAVWESYVPGGSGAFVLVLRGASNPDVLPPRGW
jgi:hypothetical protein